MADTEAVEVNTSSGAIEEPIEPNVSPTTGQKLENLHVRTSVHVFIYNVHVQHTSSNLSLMVDCRRRTKATLVPHLPVVRETLARNLPLEQAQWMKETMAMLINSQTMMSPTQAGTLISILKVYINFYQDSFLAQSFLDVLNERYP